LVLAAPRRTPGPSSTPPVHEPDQDRYDALLDTFSRALRRLLRTPVPDLPALALKIELAIDQAAWESTGGETSMAALKRDARRLAAPPRA
jgi:hypothetical protein